MSKKITTKVKRPKMNWYALLMETGCNEAKHDFYVLLARHPNMSMNRIAYNALKRNYSTTTLEACRWCGYRLVDFYD